MVEKKNDYHHINVAELDAVLKGVNLAIKQGLRENEIRTDTKLGDLYSGGEWKNMNKGCWRSDCKTEIRDTWRVDI